MTAAIGTAAPAREGGAQPVAGAPPIHPATHWGVYEVATKAARRRAWKPSRATPRPSPIGIHHA